MESVQSRLTPSRGSRHPRRRRLHVSLIVAVAAALAAAPTASAAPTAPLAGAHATGYASNSTLTFKFAGASIPSWFTSAGSGARLVLETEWETNNRTGMPRFTYSSGGTGTVVWSTATASPCSGTNTAWLACTPGANGDDWKIYVRNFSASGKSSWAWSESGGCAGKTCFDLSRSVLHEAMHIFLGIGGHDESGETNTIMSATQPSNPAAGWDTNSLRSCDVATGQIFYDLHYKSDAYAQCLSAVSGMSNGIATKITMADTSYTACSGQLYNFSAEARVGNFGSLGLLANNPLTGRTIKVYRRPPGGTFSLVTSVTATTTPYPSPNVSATLSESTQGTWIYKFRYDSTGSGIDQMLRDADGPEFTVNWVSTRSCQI